MRALNRSKTAFFAIKNGVQVLSCLMDVRMIEKENPDAIEIAIVDKKKNFENYHVMNRKNMLKKQLVKRISFVFFGSITFALRTFCNFKEIIYPCISNTRYCLMFYKP
ncbi:hypothetical protein MBGDF03_00975 [Thermoplasmatales archaeon SCGC AB-540-F20]|nr:hypothetical protein MBGDF03_00975 [Thermoplasmatales archaeon SCGC AB-540-F20]